MYANTNVHVTIPDKLDSLLLVSTQNQNLHTKGYYYRIKTGWVVDDFIIKLFKFSYQSKLMLCSTELCCYYNLGLFQLLNNYPEASHLLL